MTILATAVALVSACSINTDTTPSRIELPPTDQLSTESEISTPTTSVPDSPDTLVDLPRNSIGRVIAAAPRVDNANYHEAAQTPTGPRVPTSGFHFSTPQRSVTCSVAAGGRATLACRINGSAGSSGSGSAPRRPCAQAADIVTLSSSGPQQGECAGDHPILFKPNTLESGRSIALSRITCLATSGGILCIESRSRSGFAIEDGVYREIDATDPAPAGLSGETRNDPNWTSDNNESGPIPTS